MKRFGGEEAGRGETDGEREGTKKICNHVAGSLLFCTSHFSWSKPHFFFLFFVVFILAHGFSLLVVFASLVYAQGLYVDYSILLHIDVGHVCNGGKFLFFLISSGSARVGNRKR